MREIGWTKLKQATAKDIREGPCLKVMSDDEFIGYLVIDPQGPMRDRIEGLAGLIDASKGLN